MILFNAVILGLETSDQVMAAAGPLITILDRICLGIFVVEIALKLIAQGPRFFRSGWNLFDFAIVGVALPGVPTVPFLLLSAWFAAKGSERLHRWLYAHPKFGKILIDWEEQGAISRSSKIMTVIMLVVSWVIMYFVNGNPWLMGGLALMFTGTLTFVLSRPEPR